VEYEFSEVRRDGVLRSSPLRSSPKFTAEKMATWQMRPSFMYATLLL
jgi:hypothetical protein